MDIIALGLIFLTIFFIIGFRNTSFVFKSEFPKSDSPKSESRGFNFLKFDFLKYIFGILQKSDEGYITREGAAIIGTLTILGCSLYIILSNDYDSGTKNWAFSSVGAILGFWLRK